MCDERQKAILFFADVAMVTKDSPSVVGYKNVIHLVIVTIPVIS